MPNNFSFRTKIFLVLFLIVGFAAGVYLLLTLFNPEKDYSKEPALVSEITVSDPELKYMAEPIPVTPLTFTETASISAQKASEVEDGVSPDSESEEKKEVEILILDLRDRDRYAEGHIPGALPLPRDVILTGEFTLPKNSIVVVYDEDAAALDLENIQKNLQIKGAGEIQFLEIGYEGWIQEGGAVEIGDPYSPEEGEEL